MTLRTSDIKYQGFGAPVAVRTSGLDELEATEARKMPEGGVRCNERSDERKGLRDFKEQMGEG